MSVIRYIGSIMATIKQKALAREVASNVGKTSMKDAMLKVGYSQSMAESPDKVTKTATWKQLMEQYLPDKLLNKTAKQGLKATTYREVDGKTKLVKDFAVRQRYLETALKMKNKLNDKLDVSVTGAVIGFTMLKPVKELDSN